MAAHPDKIWRVHARIANARRDYLHKLTTRLVEDFDTVVVEDFNVAGMRRAGRAYTKRLNRALHDAAIRRQVTYNSDWVGTSLVVADRWFPSSRTCSSCEVVKAKLPLKVRVLVCAACGFRSDRDVNAACNLAALAKGVEGGTSSASCGQEVMKPYRIQTRNLSLGGLTVLLREHHVVVNVAGLIRRSWRVH